MVEGQLCDLGFRLHEVSHTRSHYHNKRFITSYFTIWICELASCLRIEYRKTIESEKELLVLAGPTCRKYEIPALGPSRLSANSRGR